jgi:hypothetical protein
MPKLVTVIGLLAALIFIAASAMTNFVFASSLGKTPIEGHILGAVSVAADMFKAILPLIIVHAFRTTRYGVMLWGSVLFVVVLVFSFTSALGLIASNRSGVVGARAVSVERGVQIARELAGLETLHAALPAHRAVAIIEEVTIGLKQDKRWMATRGCMAIGAGAEARTYCESYAALRIELAASHEAARLEQSSLELKKELRALNDMTNGADADPQVKLIASLIGHERAATERLLIFLCATLIELGAALSLFLTIDERQNGERKGIRNVADDADKEASNKTATSGDPFQRPASVIAAPIGPTGIREPSVVARTQRGKSDSSRKTSASNNQ